MEILLTESWTNIVLSRHRCCIQRGHLSLAQPSVGHNTTYLFFMSLSDGIELAGGLLLVLIRASFGPSCELTPSLMPALDPLVMISDIKPKTLLCVGGRTWVDSSKEYAVVFLRVACSPLKTGTRTTGTRSTQSR